MESLGNLLQTKRPNEPPQLKSLRKYVLDHHGEQSKTGVSQMGYTLTVASAPLASLLQMDMQKIREACNLDKKLFIRIGIVE